MYGQCVPSRTQDVVQAQAPTSPVSPVETFSSDSLDLPHRNHLGPDSFEAPKMDTNHRARYSRAEAVVSVFISR